nr:MAG TPA: hypothetical protein [Bacteriophage sp.]
MLKIIYRYNSVHTAIIIDKLKLFSFIKSLPINYLSSCRR